jgi:ferric-chelate reductase
MIPRHIQDFSNASGLEPHWGYVDRVLPCTNDAGSCAYLDVVYHSHDMGMLYTGIMWSVIGGVLLVWAILRRLDVNTRPSNALNVFSRRWLLPEFRMGRFIFGQTTRLQVVVLACAAAYLLIFSFAGITYATWITPVKNSPGVYNTRVSLGPWSDRVGVLAFALTPLSILLANRESLLSALTGVPYQHFNFLHRWLGHIILTQSVLHTIGWCVIEIRLYQPQPSVATAWIKQPYMIWGIVALILLLLLWGLSTSYARRAFGYEFFRKAHYVLAMVYIGACWAHWANLKCFLLPSLLLWFADRGVRFARTALIHYRVLPHGRGIFATIPAKLTHFEDNVVRADLDYPMSWAVGQHYYVCFVDGGIWQSHPFTPLSVPGTSQSYVFRGKRGETKRIASSGADITPVILTGPYGVNILEPLTQDTNVLCIAGGTGITFVLPVVLYLAQNPTARIELVWVVRSEHNTEWIAPELDKLRDNDRIRIAVHVTRRVRSDIPNNTSRIGEKALDEESGENSGSVALGQRPDLSAVVRDFVIENVAGSTCVYVSGPGGMVSDVRQQVVQCNDPGRVWKGEQRADVRLVCDDRLE